MSHNESAFRDARKSINPQPCAFEKALLSRCCQCSLGQAIHIAEHEAVACTVDEARQACLALRAELRHRSVFALKLADADAPLPHTKEMKVQCGGLQGLQRVLARGSPTAAVEDVSALVQAALARYLALEQLPYSEIMQTVAAFEIRRRRTP